MPESPDLEQFAEYYHLSEQLVADATKKELVECARLLALQVAHYQAKYGESLLEQGIATATTDDPDPATAKLLNEGVQIFVGVLAMQRDLRWIQATFLISALIAAKVARAS